VERGDAVNNVLPILLFALGGILVGGAISMRRQGAPTAAVAVLGLMALLAIAAGALRLIYE
jgi:hypothetical protein